MRHFDEGGSAVEVDAVDESAGQWRPGARPVTHRWVVDSPAVTEERVVAEYDNGGRDVEIVEVTPETGHWETTDDATGEAIEWDGDRSGLLHGEPTPDVEPVAVWHAWTDDERAAVEAAREEGELWATVPDALADGSTAVSDLADALAELSATVSGIAGEEKWNG